MADMWACGIILYQLHTLYHPYYSKGDSFENLLEKINQTICYPENFSKYPLKRMIKSLFINLCRVEPINRYLPEEALKHPFITKNILSPPPLTLIEALNLLNAENHINQVKNNIRFIKLCSLFLILNQTLNPENFWK